MKKINCLIALIIAFSVQNAFCQWEQINNGLFGGTIKSVALSGNNIIALAGNGLFKGSIDGQVWKESSTGLHSNINIHSVIGVGTNFFLCSDSGLFKSNDYGDSWIKSSNGLPLNSSVNTITNDGENFYLGSGNGLFFSSNKGNQWSQIGFKDTSIKHIAVSGSSIFVVTENKIFDMGVVIVQNLFRSTNSGKSWVVINDNKFNNIPVYCIGIKGNIIFAGTDFGLYQSTDNGDSWSQNTNGLYTYNYIECLYLKGTNLFAGTNYQGIYESTDNGHSWFQVTNGISTYASIWSISGNGDTVLVGTNGLGLYETTNKGANWKLNTNGLNSSPQIECMAMNGTTIFAGIHYSTLLHYCPLYISTDNGDSWALDTAEMTQNLTVSIASNQSKVYVITPGILFESNDNGLSWKKDTINGLKHENYATIVTAINNIVYLGTYNNGLLQSSDNGNSWQVDTNGLPNPQKVIYSIAANKAAIFACLSSSFQSVKLNALYRSTDNGNSWAIDTNGLPTNPKENPVNCISAKDDIVFAGTNGFGIYQSTDNGQTWTQNTNGIPADANISCFQIYGKNIFAGTTNGVYLSSDNGNQWAQIGLTGSAISCFVMDKTYIYSGTSGDGVFRAKLSEFGLTDVANTNISNDIIKIIPNPASDNIKIVINSKGFINTGSQFSIVIYNELGIPVYDNINISGNNIINIETTNFVSGTYFCNIIYGNQKAIKKFVVLKN